jgi:hypothetical protein
MRVLLRVEDAAIGALQPVALGKATQLLEQLPALPVP